MTLTVILEMIPKLSILSLLINCYIIQLVLNIYLLTLILNLHTKYIHQQCGGIHLKKVKISSFKNIKSNFAIIDCFFVTENQKELDGK